MESLWELDLLMASRMYVPEKQKIRLVVQKAGEFLEKECIWKFRKEKPRNLYCDRLITSISSISRGKTMEPLLWSIVTANSFYKNKKRKTFQKGKLIGTIYCEFLSQLLLPNWNNYCELLCRNSPRERWQCRSRKPLELLLWVFEPISPFFLKIQLLTVTVP